MPLPIAPMVLPGDLVGVENGRVPEALMVKVARAGGGADWFHRTAYRCYLAMADECYRHTGYALDWTPGGAYRSYAAHLAEWHRRYYRLDPGVPMRKGDKWWDNAWWRNRDPSRFATLATPGNTNHGLGLAWDFAHRNATLGKFDGISTKAVGWLVVNAHRFGFSAELQSEKWHWRYVAGDNIPAAVLAFEGGRPPQESAMEAVALGSSCKRAGDGRVGHYRAVATDMSGTIRVFGLNGATIAAPTGSAFGLPYTDIANPGAEFLGLIPAPDHGGVVACYGQGITFDVQP